MNKRKSDFINIFDELRSEDSKKRLNSVRNLKQLAKTLGPLKTRSELIPFLLGKSIRVNIIEFIDDDETIILQLLDIIQQFCQFLGGLKHEHLLLPFLIAICKIDEKKIALRSTTIINRILKNNHEFILQTVEQLCQNNMIITKHSLAIIIIGSINNIPNEEKILLKYYLNLFQTNSQQCHIVAAQYLYKLLITANHKQQLGSMLNTIYDDQQELIKLYALQALIHYYTIQPNNTVIKLTNLIKIDSWRINLKILQLVAKIAETISKTHFKNIMEQFILKLALSFEPEIRAASCEGLYYVTNNLNDEEIINKILPILNKLCKDNVDFVQISISKYIVKLCLVSSINITEINLIPLLVEMLDSKDQQLFVGIFYDCDILFQKLGSVRAQQILLQPLLNIFNHNNWRIKCKIIDLLQQNINIKLLQNNLVIGAVIQLTNNHIDAVRRHASTLITSIIQKQDHSWVNSILIPKLYILGNNKNYIRRQNFLKVIKDTCTHVSEQTRQNYYKPMIIKCLKDEVPNVRIKALGILKENKKLIDKTVQKQLHNLKEEKDDQVFLLVKSLRS